MQKTSTTLLAVGLISALVLVAVTLGPFAGALAAPSPKAKSQQTSTVIHASCSPESATIPPHSTIQVVCGAFGEEPIFGLRNNDRVVGAIQNNQAGNLVITDVDTHFDFNPDEDASVQFTVRNLTDEPAEGPSRIDFIAWRCLTEPGGFSLTTQC